MPALKKKGFTIIELLVVVAIIGLLSIVVVAVISVAKARSRDGVRVSDVNIIQKALELYQNNYEKYPAYTGNLTGIDGVSVALKGSGLINNMPLDPINDVADGIPYFYYYDSDGLTYVIEYYLETNSVEGRSKGLNTARPF